MVDPRYFGPDDWNAPAPTPDGTLGAFFTLDGFAPPPAGEPRAVAAGVWADGAVAAGVAPE